jgi:hypothetical protein
MNGYESGIDGDGYGGNMPLTAGQQHELGRESAERNAAGSASWAAYAAYQASAEAGIPEYAAEAGATKAAIAENERVLGEYRAECAAEDATQASPALTSSPTCNAYPADYHRSLDYEAGQ